MDGGLFGGAGGGRVRGKPWRWLRSALNMQAPAEWSAVWLV
jgi:hypothetical protein